MTLPANTETRLRALQRRLQRWEDDEDGGILDQEEELLLDIKQCIDSVLEVPDGQD